jgi:hypothetical protein
MDGEREREMQQEELQQDGAARAREKKNVPHQVVPRTRAVCFVTPRASTKMAITARGTMLLRQLNTLLNQDLGYLDLRTLPIQAAALLSSELERKRWADVLRTVAPTLRQFSDEVEAIHRYLDQQQRGAKWLFAILVLAWVGWGVGTLVWLLDIRQQHTTWAACVTPMCSALGITLLLMAFMNVWVTSLYRRFRKGVGHLDQLRKSPTLQGFDRINVMLTKTFLVRYAMFDVTGRTKPELLFDLYGGGKVPNPRGGCDAEEEVDGQGKCELEGISPCNPDYSQYPALENVVQYDNDKAPKLPDSCPLRVNDAQRRTVRDMLQDLKADVSRYDSLALWREVAAGVEGLRRMVYAQHDHGGSAGDGADGKDGGGGALTEADVQRVVREEVMPLFRLGMLETLSAKPASTTMQATQVVPGVDSKRQCWQKCMDANAQLGATGNADTLGCAWAYFAKDDKKCYRSPTTLGLLLDYDGRDRDDGATSVSSDALLVAASTTQRAPLYVCGKVDSAGESVGSAAFLPDAPRLRVDSEGRVLEESRTEQNAWCSGRPDCQVLMSDAAWKMAPRDTFSTFFAASRPVPGKAVTEACVKTTQQELYADGLPRAGVLLAELSDVIAAKLAAISASYNHQFKLDAWATSIKSDAADFYGPRGGDVGPAVAAVLAKARDLIADAKARAEDDKYVSPARFAAKVKAMSADQWNAFAGGARKMGEAARDHAKYFPYTPLRNDRMPIYVGWWTAAGFVALVSALLTLLMRVRSGDMTREAGVRAVLLFGCAFSIATVAAGLLVTKRVAREDHNDDAIQTNGFRLVTAAQQFAVAVGKPALSEAQRNDMVTLVEAPAVKPEDPEQVTRVLRAAIAVVEAYDRCNSITTASASAPFPTMDLVMYGVVAVIVIGGAAFALSRLDAGGKLSNIRALLDARARVRRGEITPAVQEIATGSSPHDSEWLVLVWVCVVILCVLNLYFMLNTRADAQRYQASIHSNDDCV